MSRPGQQPPPSLGSLLSTDDTDALVRSTVKSFTKGLKRIINAAEARLREEFTRLEVMLSDIHQERELLEQERSTLAAMRELLEEEREHVEEDRLRVQRQSVKQQRGRGIREIRFADEMGHDLVKAKSLPSEAAANFVVGAGMQSPPPPLRPFLHHGSSSSSPQPRPLSPAAKDFLIGSSAVLLDGQSRQRTRTPPPSTSRSSTWPSPVSPHVARSRTWASQADVQRHPQMPGSSRSSAVSSDGMRLHIGQRAFAVLPPAKLDGDMIVNEDFRNRIVEVPVGWQIVSTSMEDFETIIALMTTHQWGTPLLVVQQGDGNCFSTYRTPLSKTGTPGSKYKENTAHFRPALGHGESSQRQLRFAYSSGRLVICTSQADEATGTLASTQISDMLGNRDMKSLVDESV